MKHVSAGAAPTRPVEEEGAVGATICELVTAADGAPTFAMRLFELLPGGHTIYHTHPWEHEVFILAGSGVVLVGPDGDVAFGPSSAIYLERDRPHQFRNTGSEPVRFICCIPVAQSCANLGPTNR